MLFDRPVLPRTVGTRSARARRSRRLILVELGDGKRRNLVIIEVAILSVVLFPTHVHGLVLEDQTLFASDILRRILVARHLRRLCFLVGER